MASHKGNKRSTKRKIPLVKKHGSMVLALTQAPPHFRKKMLKDAPKELINCISECCQNILKGNVPLSKAQLQKLKSKRELLRHLADKSISVQKKKQYLNQKGGILPLLKLAPILAPTIAKIIADI